MTCRNGPDWRVLVKDRREMPRCAPKELANAGCNRKIRLVRRHDHEYESRRDILSRRGRLGRKGFRHIRPLLHAALGRLYHGRRTDADPRGRPQSPHQSGVDGLHRGRRCRCLCAPCQEVRRRDPSRSRRHAGGWTFRRRRRSTWRRIHAVCTQQRSTAAAGAAGHTRPHRLARTLRGRPGKCLCVLFRSVWLDQGGSRRKSGWPLSDLRDRRCNGRRNNDEAAAHAAVRLALLFQCRCYRHRDWTREGRQRRGGAWSHAGSRRQLDRPMSRPARRDVRDGRVQAVIGLREGLLCRYVTHRGGVRQHGIFGPGPAWMGYIGVDDVDAYARRVKKSGGAIHRGPENIPGVGRFAVAGDPHGAGFMLFAPNSDQQPAPVLPGTPGHVGWHDLYAGDRESAFAFYSGLFGWTKAEAVESPAGLYQTFATGGAMVGGIMTKPPHMPQSGWLYYFNVDAIDTAIGRVKAGSGEVLHGPMQVPRGSWIAQCRDPQGAMFAMVACKR